MTSRPSPARQVLLLCISMLPAFLHAADAGLSSDGTLESLLNTFRKCQPAVDEMLLSARIGEALGGTLTTLPGQKLDEKEKSMVDEVNRARKSTYEVMSRLLHKSVAEVVADRVSRYEPLYQDGVFREARKAGKVEWSNGQFLDEVLSKSVITVLSAPPAAIMERSPFTVRVSLTREGQPLNDFRLNGRELEIVGPADLFSGPVRKPLLGESVEFSLTISHPQKQVKLTVGMAGSASLEKATVGPFDVEKFVDPKEFERQYEELKKYAEIFLKDDDSAEKVRQLNKLHLEVAKLYDTLRTNAAIPAELLQKVDSLRQQLKPDPN